MEVTSESNNVAFAESMLNVQHQLGPASCNDRLDTRPHNSQSNQDKIPSDSAEKHSAIWTCGATVTLLKLYESNLKMLETPKRKKRIWLAISANLRDYNIDMSADQVRWKINALTKKYKRCIENGVHARFKYFNEMDHIHSQFNIDSHGSTISEILETSNNNLQRNPLCKNLSMKSESKTIIELRKLRLSNRMESDRSQTKLHIERQWLDYLKRQEQLRLQKEKVVDKNLTLKEQKLELRRRNFELRQDLDSKSIQLMENDVQNSLQAEREKLELLKHIFI